VRTPWKARVHSHDEGIVDLTMLSSSKLKRAAAGLAAVAAASAVAGAITTGGASADPAQFNAFATVGSDTTQDVLNALSGKTNGVLFNPIQSSAATGGVQIISWDATPPTGVADNCITPKIGAPTFTRPNGSSAGQRALSRSIDGGGYGGSTANGAAFCASADVSGLIDFARSSSLDSTAGTQLTYVPFARDALTFAYYRPAGNAGAVTQLTRTQLDTLFTSGPQTINGVRIVPCGIQSGSGTKTSWESTVGVSSGEEDTATDLCSSVVNATSVPNSQTGGRLQEHNAVHLKQAGDALVAALPAEANSQVIVGFSASQYISRARGNGVPQPPADVILGSISNDGAGNNIGSPVTGTYPNFTPVAVFFNNATFGRSVYNVFPTSTIAGPGNLALKSLFSGPTSSLCQATATIQAMGFLVDPSCGDLSLQRGLRSGNF
jgi:ABC-type phosphate transport system substrate-binding protein